MTQQLADRVSNLTAVLSQVSADATRTFGALSAEQLNWTSDPSRWSVAQCFDHLIRVHAKYFPIFDRLAAGDVQMSTWARWSPFSGFFGRLFISSLDPENKAKRPTSPNAKPSSSKLGADIIKQFAAHQADLIAHVQRLPASLDPEAIVITSPLLSVVTYPLDDVLVFLGLHCRRHFDQARRVTESPGFGA